jgi:hypothetical protein
MINGIILPQAILLALLLVINSPAAWLSNQEAINFNSI